MASPVTAQLRRNLLPPDGGRVETTRDAPAGEPSRVICSLATGGDRQFLLESVSTFAAYAQRHRWSLLLSSEPLGDRTKGAAQLALVQELLAAHDFVLSIEPDAVFADLNRDLLDEVTDDADVWFAGPPDSASILVRSCPGTKAFIAAALAAGGQPVPTDSRTGRFDAGPTSVIHHHSQIEDVDLRCQAIAGDREATKALFPSDFRHLRSPSSAGVDHAPRRSQAFGALQIAGEPSVAELLDMIGRLDTTNEAQRARIVELLDLLEVAADERVQAERRADELAVHAANVESELELLRNTKLFRLAAPARRAYARLSRRRHD